MKQNIIIVTMLCTLFFSCKNNSNSNQAKADTTAKLTYPFTPKYTVNWQQGDEKNTVIVIACLSIISPVI